MDRLPLGTLGIMCCSRQGSPPFSGEGYYRRLTVLGRKYGIRVIVFRPADAAQDHSFVTGFTYRKGAWHEGRFPFPDIIYDRCLFHSQREFAEVASLLSEPHSAKGWILWSRGLPGKWQVYRVLKKERCLHTHLPPTKTYQGKESLLSALESYDGEVFLKPGGGSQGKSTLYIRKDPAFGNLHIMGRDSLNQPLEKNFASKAHALRWIQEFTQQRSYLIQPFLHLYGRNSRSFDIRVLMQKNEKGLWMRTGMAVREGAAGSMTSNLHGGGKALPVLPYLIGQFGADRAEHMSEVLRQLSEIIPLILEGHYGRLGELGIDFGIDVNGSIWILEVNSKPGRTSIRQAGDPETAVLASENPLRYARYLLLRQLRRVN
ncbi:YheC/YheD family protein [Paenibacillus sp.]|jgi:glutathione synthase/RimK-type ligase-like ATP-grasp enzyme|uniref:YheC/YheD family endospore coat-associated protein n=1 Tax=Paenibacillus sp. TaxID=58172 RepID=UPI0028295F7E|nr:YheC/YheD family protein [Paenibacillus sp.]MDR0266850.1 YheC/YheD family protein [Paenibacillus sp.]